jgi:hypothetical protein
MGGIWAFTTGMVSNIYPLAPSGRSSRPRSRSTRATREVRSSIGRGRVLGIVTAGLQEASSLNFAIRIEQACTALPPAVRALSAAGRCARPTACRCSSYGVMVGKGPLVSVPAFPRSYEVFAVVKGQMRKKKVLLPAERSVDLTR